MSSFSGALQCRCKRPTLAPAHASNKWHLPYNPPRSLTDDVRRQAPKWQDLAAERVQLEGGADGWRFTKSHTVYQQDGGACKATAEAGCPAAPAAALPSAGAAPRRWQQLRLRPGGGSTGRGAAGQGAPPGVTQAGQLVNGQHAWGRQCRCACWTTPLLCVHVHACNR